MPSRLWLTLPLAFTGACGLQLFERKEAPPPLELNAAETGCLEKAPEDIAAFLGGAGSAAAVRKDLACAEGALRLFRERTRGAETGRYSRTELQQFLTRYFLNGRELPDSFYRSAFELKSALLGGEPDGLTHGELVKASDFVTLAGAQLLRLEPYLPLAGLAKDPDSARVDPAAGVIADVAGQLAGFVEQSGESYTFEQLDRGLAEIARIFPGFSVDGSQRALKLLQTWKTVFVVGPGTTADRIGHREWRSLLTESARAYGLFLKFGQLFANADQFVCGAARERLVELGFESVGALERSLDVRGLRAVSFSDLERFVAVVDARRLPLSRATLLAVYRPFVNKILRRQPGGGVRVAEDRQPSLLTRADLRALRQLLSSWNLGQRLVEKPFLVQGQTCAARTPLTALFADRGVPPAFFAQPLHKILGSDAIARLNALERRDLDDTRAQLARLAPLWELDRPAPVLGRTGRTQSSYLELSLRNSAGELVRTVLTAYAGGAPISEAALTEFYRDIRPLGVELKLMDPRLQNWASSRFREANLFTPVSNGDLALDADEFVLFVNEVLPARAYAYRIHREAAARCPALRADVYGNPSVEAGCYFRFLKLRLESLDDVAPHFAGFYRNLGDAGREDLLATLRGVMLPAGERSVDSPYSEIFGALLHFEEILVERWDLNHNRTLDEDEALRMVPTFRNILIEKSGLSGQSDLDAVLTFTLAHGEPPTKSLGGIAQFLLWKLRRPFWNFEADHLSVFKVFGAFGESPY